MTELFLNSNRIELGDSVISQTKQIGSFFDLRDRRASFTNTINIPRTIYNESTLGNIGILGSESIIAYRRVSCSLVVNGIETTTNAYAVVQSMSEDSIKISIKDGNANIFKLLGSKKLSDLDLSDFAHELTNSSISDTYGNDWTDGYIYAVAEYGLINPTFLLTDYTTPCFFKRWLFNEIMDSIGLSYQGDAITTGDFNERVLSSATGFNTDIDSVTPFVVSEWNSANQVNITDIEYFDVSQLAPVTSVVSDPDGAISDNSFVALETGRHRCTIDVGGGYTFYEYGLGQINIKRNGVTVGFMPFEGVPQNIFVYLNEGDTITYNVRVISEQLVGGQFRANFEASFTPIVYYDNEGIHVNPYELIPDITQADFFRSVVRELALVYAPSIDNPNLIKFESIADIIAESPENLGLQIGAVISQSFKISGLSQLNTVDYDYADEEDTGFADGQFIIDNKTLDETPGTYFKLPYTASRIGAHSVVSLSDVRWQNLPLWLAQRDENGDITGWEEQDSGPFSGVIEMVNGTMPNRFSDDIAGGSFSGDIPFFRFTKLSGEWILEEKYSSYLPSLNRAQTIIFEALMSAIDYNKIDLMKVYNVPKFGVNIFINKISSFKGSGVVRIEAAIIS